MNFERFAQVTKAFAQWQTMTAESFQRGMSFFTEFEKFETKGIERAAVAVDEVSVNVKETLAYGAQLGAEWRKLQLEAIKQMSAAFAPAPKAD